MGSRRIRLFTVAPGTRNLRPLVTKFCAKGYGMITATSDLALSEVRSVVPEDSEVDVETFGAFVQGLLARINQPSLGLVHNGHYIESVASACAGLGEDSPFHLSKSFRGVHRRIGDCLKELASYGFSVDKLDLTEVPTSLAAKLLELKKIEDEVAGSLRLLGKEVPTQHIARLLTARAAKGELPDRVMVVLDGEAAPRKLDVLLWLEALGINITATLPMHPTKEAEVFVKADSIAGYLGVTAQQGSGYSGLQATLFCPPGIPPDESSAASDVSGDQADLFGSEDDKSAVAPKEEPPNPGPRIILTSSADVLAECEAALATVTNHLASGLPPSALAIYARDLESYAPLLQASAMRARVRLSCPRRIRLMTNALAKLTLKTLRACAGPDVRALDSLVKRVALTREQSTEALAQLREAHQPGVDSWAAMAEWCAAEPEARKWLSEILVWRSEAHGRPRTLEEWVTHLRGLRPHFPNAEDAESTARDDRAWSAMQRTLGEVASLARLREPGEISLSRFCSICADTWEDADVSLPVNEGGVLVTSHAQSLGDRKLVLVLDLVEGIFPRRRKEDAILSDRERQMISRAASLKLPLPTSFDALASERDEFYRICSAATVEIHASFPRTAEDRENIPSFYLEELGRCGDVPLVASNDEPSDGFLTLSALKSEDPALSEELAIRLRPADRHSPAELREALQCGFQFFTKRVLGVRRSDLSSHWHHLRWLPQQSSLVSAVAPEEAKAALESALASELDSRFGELPDWELPLLQAGGRRLIAEWVGREFASREKWKKVDNSRRSQTGFGNGLRADLGKGVVLTGRVAGSSRLGEYSVVHLVESRSPDIRSGSVELSDPDALYYGLYLLSICEQASGAAVEVEGMDGRRTLMVMPRLSGTVLPSDARENLQFVDLGDNDDPFEAKRAFYRRVKDLLSVAIERIRSLDVRPNPGDYCQWCDYGELCRRSQEFGEEVSRFEQPRNHPLN